MADRRDGIGPDVIPERDALVAVRTLTAAYPNHPVEPDVVALWVTQLAQPPFDDVAVLHEAINAHIRTSQWFPSVAQMVDAYTVAARARLADRLAADEARAIARGTMPGMPAVPVEYGTEMVDVLRTAMARTFGAGRVHRHPGGDPTMCPTCTQADGIARSVAAEVDALRSARGLTGPPGAVPTYACPRCHDVEYVEVADSDTWKPCPLCNTSAFDRWQAGHWRPGHTCAECEGIHRGKQPAM